MGDKAYKEQHKKRGLCVDCSNPAMPERNLCINCARKQRARVRAYKDRKTEKGICENCLNPVVPGRKLCASCIVKNKIDVKKWRQRHGAYMIEYNREMRKLYRKENKCLACGIKLGEQDQGHVTCLNCRLNLHASEGGLYNATYNKKSAS